MLFINRVKDIVRYNIKRIVPSQSPDSQPAAVIKGTSIELKPFEKTNDVISKKKSLKSTIELPKTMYSPKPILLEKNYNKIIDSKNIKLYIDYKNINKNEKKIILFFMIVFLFISINLYKIYNKNVRYILTNIKYPLRIV